VTSSGICFPSLTIPTLTDVRSSEMRGAVEMTESKFYIENVQEPISRACEIIFKTILFSNKSFIIEEKDGPFLSRWNNSILHQSNESCMSMKTLDKKMLRLSLSMLVDHL
jgi:hypothetical protein